jgi:hypothetical protein
VYRYVVTKVGAALQSCHHANDQLWRADLLLAEATHIREEPEIVIKPTLTHQSSLPVALRS